MKDLRAVFNLFCILHGSGYLWVSVRYYMRQCIEGKSSLDALKELAARLQREVTRTRYWQAKAEA